MLEFLRSEDFGLMDCSLFPLMRLVGIVERWSLILGDECFLERLILRLNELSFSHRLVLVLIFVLLEAFLLILQLLISHSF